MKKLFEKKKEKKSEMKRKNNKTNYLRKKLQKTKRKKNQTSTKQRNVVSKVLTTTSSKPEIKTLDIGLDLLQPFSNVAQFKLLNGIKQGAAYYNRIGKKISMKSVRVEIQVYTNPDGDIPGGHDYLRFILVYDRQANGAFPTYTTLMQLRDVDGNTSTSCKAYLNMDYSERFVILRDERVPIFETQNDATSKLEPYELCIGTQNASLIDWYVKLDNLETQYQTSTEAVGSITSGSLFVVCMGWQNPGTQCAYLGDIQARLRYLDI